MALSLIKSVAFCGLEALLVHIEVDVIDTEKISLVIVGLPDTAVKESKDRVLTAIKNIGLSTRPVQCIVNLAPGDLRKEGPLYDLPIALGLLQALKIIPVTHLCDYLIVGELGLGGEVRAIPGAIAIALLAKALNKKGILIPAVNAPEAAVVPGIDVIPIATLQDAVRFFQTPGSIHPLPYKEHSELFQAAQASVDLSEIKGQAHVKRALEIAAAGNHNLILSGPPGSGKTMLSKALLGLMPELSLEEALQTTRIHSIAGLLPEGQHLVHTRPFRAPHHTVSYAGLIGGGSTPRPGEVSLAHNGILFLDELPEFSRSVLEVLRQPLESKDVTISRANGSWTFPANFLCVCAMNPCPCGYLGHPDKGCRDTELQVQRYRGKISGPLLDRIDMHIEVPALSYAAMSQIQAQENSFTVRQRVTAARLIQKQRLGGARTNAVMSNAELKKDCTLDEEGWELMRHAIDIMGLSARAHNRVLKVARTIADLEGVSHLAAHHVMEALQFRSRSHLDSLDLTRNAL